MFENNSLSEGCTESGLKDGASAAAGAVVPLEISEIALDPACPSDEPFLYHTFAGTRADEMAMTGWNAAQQESFLRMQYEAQRSSYRMQLPEAKYWVIRRGKTAVGRLIVDRAAQDIHIVDIALLPQFRAQGIGSALIAAIMSEARAESKSVSLHVERFNPALQWYERLGFRAVRGGPIYLEMVWRPGAASPEKIMHPESQAQAEAGVAYGDGSH